MQCAATDAILSQKKPLRCIGPAIHYRAMLRERRLRIGMRDDALDILKLDRPVFHCLAVVSKVYDAYSQAILLEFLFENRSAGSGCDLMDEQA